jgi:beta-glucosidase
VHGLDAATAGLDQESAGTLDGTVYFGAPLKAAIQSGQIPAARLDDMVRRILYGMIANGLLDPAAPAGALDARADDPVAQTEAEAAIVLLKNRGDILPLAASARRIAVIGGHADVGVLSGGGSAQVVPAGSIRLPAPAGAPDWVRGIYYHPSAPLAAIRAHAKGATVDFASGQDISAAVAAARAADVAIVFAEQWASEAIDVCIRLSQAQEDLITAVAAANPHTVVVLESGGPVLAPWADRVGALVEAWYPGGRGGEAIARVLFGEVDPSGRLPVTFAASADQWPRSQPQGPVENLTLPEDKQTPFAVDYKEGSSVGYRWFAQNGYKPRFPFGYGLSYTRFRYGALSATGGQTVTVRLPITNTGARRGRETAQLYLLAGPQRSQKRLLGWAKVELEPGQTQIVRIQADPRLLANWDEHAHAWRLDGGRYTVVAAANAGDPGIKAVVAIKGSVLKP